MDIDPAFEEEVSKVESYLVSIVDVVMVVTTVSMKFVVVVGSGPISDRVEASIACGFDDAVGNAIFICVFSNFDVSIDSASKFPGFERVVGNRRIDDDSFGTEESLFAVIELILEAGRVAGTT